jgi:hypothetical protein
MIPKLDIKTMRHVTLVNVCDELPETLFDVVAERLHDSDLSWGSNAETFARKGHIRNVIESAWDDWQQGDDAPPEFLQTSNAYRATLAALDALPDDVFISLGG